MNAKLLVHVCVGRYLHGNLITDVERDDFCNMTNLQNLYLGGNRITEDRIHADAFQCLPKLDLL